MCVSQECLQQGDSFRLPCSVMKRNSKISNSDVTCKCNKSRKDDDLINMHAVQAVLCVLMSLPVIFKC